jgi:hypothetical protein
MVGHIKSQDLWKEIKIPPLNKNTILEKIKLEKVFVNF